MGKNNSFLARQQLRQRILIDNARRYTIQQCADFMLISAAEEVGFGEKRLKRPSDRWASIFDEYADMLSEDLKGDKDFEYTKSLVDRRLEKCCGKYFKPWEERYRQEG